MTSNRPTRRGKTSAAQTRTAENALLGLLAETDVVQTGVHGYDLLKRFAEGVLGDIIRIEPGMLYHHLKSMASRGLLVTTVERQVSRPDRQMHAITEFGRQTLMDWLGQPVRATRELRLEFLVKLYLTERIDPQQQDRLVAAQVEVIEQLITSLEQQIATLMGTDPDLQFRRHVLDLRVAQNHAARQWLLTLRSDSNR